MNVLTERLFAEGYTKEHHPPNVHWSGYREFEFNYKYLVTTVWETPCGLLEKGSRFGCGDTSVGGITYSPENGNPHASCPYRGELECPHILPAFRWCPQCAFHYTKRPYDYEQSCQKIEDAWDAIQYEARRKALDGFGHCWCFKWDQPSRSYVPAYWVNECINYGCENPVCAVTKKMRNLEKVNIYYDLLRITRYRIGFADFVDKSIEKGLKQLKKSVARTDAEIWLKTNGVAGLRSATTRDDRRNSHFSEYHGEQGFGEYDYYNFEAIAQNVRIEKREHRDLLQDLQDVSDGIQVTHASDHKKQAAAAKRQRREDRRAAKERAAERRHIKNWQQMIATGITPDGEPCSDDLLLFCKKELSKRGLLDVVEQISLLGEK